LEEKDEGRDDELALNEVLLHLATRPGLSVFFEARTLHQSSISDVEKVRLRSSSSFGRRGGFEGGGRREELESDRRNSFTSLPVAHCPLLLLFL